MVGNERERESARKRESACACVNVKNTRVREKEGERTGQEKKRGGKVIFKYSYQNKKMCRASNYWRPNKRQERHEKMRNEIEKARKERPNY